MEHFKAFSPRCQEFGHLAHLPHGTLDLERNCAKTSYDLAHVESVGTRSTTLGTVDDLSDLAAGFGGEYLPQEALQEAERTQSAGYLPWHITPCSV